MGTEPLQAPPPPAPDTGPAHARARPPLGAGTALAALLVILGGAAGALGSLLTWERVSVDFSLFGREGVREITRTGFETGYGQPAIAAGAVILVAGVLLLLLRGTAIRRALAVVALLAGLAAAGLALYESVQVKGRIVDDNAQGRPAEFRDRLEQAVDVGTEPGRWVVVAGGVIGLVGAAAALIAAARTREPARVAPARATTEFEQPPPGGIPPAPPPPD
ncbi:MAG TPA: Trp biosynthesis-associated membrane protein [Actinomycetota bacterium]|nr:Trp biosynthesis-associated membrane protein [Actinomycetota bacterium]